MKVPDSVSVVSCICLLVVFLCFVCQSCYGTQVSLSPDKKHNIRLDPDPSFKSLPEPTLHSFSSHEKVESPLRPHSSISKATFSSNTGLMLQNNPKEMSYSRQGLALQSLSNQFAVNILNQPSQFSNISQGTNPKPRVGSLLQPKPNVLPHSKIETGPEINPELIPNTNFSSIPSPNQTYNSSDIINPSTYYNVRTASLANLKLPSKLRPYSQPTPNAKSHLKISKSKSRSSIIAQRNQTKLLETDMDLHHRPKRGWIWNQFFVLEEHIGPDPQYVGKVRFMTICYY